jgi:hypothetical protein
MWVHHSRLAEYVQEKGYVWIETMPNGAEHLEHPDRTCLMEMARGGVCLLDKDHNGQHSQVVFGCDGCDKTRRGSPDQVDVDCNGDVLVQFCWFCVHVLGPKQEREQYEQTFKDMERMIEEEHYLVEAHNAN